MLVDRMIANVPLSGGKLFLDVHLEFSFIPLFYFSLPPGEHTRVSVFIFSELSS